METPNKSLVQYILSLGGTEMADIIEESSQGRVSLSKWKKLTPHISGSETLPWKDIDVGVSDEFLEKEYEKALKGDLTPWCETFGCYDCGACL